MNYLEDIYRISFIKRYSNIPRIHKESVAEHCFFVAAIVMDLHTKYNFDLGIALIIAISHDMTEIELNDCPHIIKKKYPQIAKAYEECEKQVADSLPESVSWGAKEYDKKNLSVESKIVHLADAMQCLQYSSIELKMGNQGYMNKVYNDSVCRIEQLEKEMKPFLCEFKNKTS